MKDPLARALKPIAHRKLRKPLSVEIKHTYHTLVITLSLLAVSTTGIYLSTNSQRLAKGYQLKALQSAYESLQSEKDKLNQKVIEAQSFLLIGNDDRIDTMENLNAELTYYVDASQLVQSGGNSRVDSATQ
jgi:phage terminase large subunit-like protein